MLKQEDMDDVFKKKLTELREPKPAKTFGEALLSPGNWTLHPAPKVEPKKIILHEEYSEKVQVIESLGRFVEEKIKDQESPVIKIMGGEIAVKPEATWDDIPEASSAHELMDFLNLDRDALEALILNKVPGQIKVLFVTEAFTPQDSATVRTGLQEELQYCFQSKLIDYTEKMISAMKLTRDDVILYPISNDGEDLSDEVMAIARCMKPQIIATFGANAAHSILKRNDKLSIFQGQFFTRSAGEDKFTIMPLYHPFILETNASMKKMTWENMQKIMAFIKKPS